MNDPGQSRQLDGVNTQAQLGPDFFPGAGITSGNIDNRSPSSKILPPNSMVQYYPPFTQNAAMPSPQAIPENKAKWGPRPSTSSANPTPGGLYPVRRFMG